MGKKSLEHLSPPMLQAAPRGPPPHGHLRLSPELLRILLLKAALGLESRNSAPPPQVSPAWDPTFGLGVGTPWESSSEVRVGLGLILAVPGKEKGETEAAGSRSADPHALFCPQHPHLSLPLGSTGQEGSCRWPKI